MRGLARFATAAACAAAFCAAIPADAQFRPGASTNTHITRARDQGYRDGLIAGQRDSRARRPYSVQRDRRDRDGYGGYHPRNGPADAFRRAYREGYAAGYRDGYGWGRDFRRLAYDNGFNEGYRKGLDDGRDGDRYAPLRHRRYRSGDHGYQRRYGDRQAYKNAYRDGFRAGYDQGYGDARRHRSRGRPGGSRWPWRF